MNLKDVIGYSLDLKQQKKSLKYILNECTKDLKGADKIYVVSCINYNHGKYIDTVKSLLNLDHQYGFKDLKLFSFAATMSLQNKCPVKIATSVLEYVHEYKHDFEDSYIQMVKSGFSLFKKKTKISKTLNKRIDYLFFEDVDDIESAINWKKIKNKTIVNSYYNNSSSGIGDFLRGCTYLYSLMSEHNVKFEIDFDRHYIGKFLDRTCHTRYKNILDTERYHKDLCVSEDYVFNMKQNLVNHLNKCSTKAVGLFSNYSDFIDLTPEMKEGYELSTDCKNFMKKNLSFNSDVKKFYNKIKRKHKLDNFHIIHFRLGDADIFKSNKVELDNNNINTKDFGIDYDYCLDEIIKTYIINKKKLIVMADSNGLKNHVIENMPERYADNIICLHTNSEHCSDNPGFIENLKIDKSKKSDNIFYVALDMYITSKCSNITSYSVYPWGSGFVFWLSKIFDIELQVNALK